MAYNENVESILDHASNIVDKINDVITPVSDNAREINDEGVTAAMVETWKGLEESVYAAVEELDTAWMHQTSDTVEEETTEGDVDA